MELFLSLPILTPITIYEFYDLVTVNPGPAVLRSTGDIRYGHLKISFE